MKKRYLFLLFTVFLLNCFGEEKNQIIKFKDSEIFNTLLTYKTEDYVENFSLYDDYYVISDYEYIGKNASAARCGEGKWKIDDDGALCIYERNKLKVTLQKIGEDKNNNLLFVYRNGEKAVYTIKECKKFEIDYE